MNEITQNSNSKSNYRLIKISKKVFTIYVGLVASGYEFSLDKQLSEKIKSVKWDNSTVEYFRKAKTNYCEVNPYWPRGSMLVTACLSLDESLGYEYSNFNKLKEKIVEYKNIDSNENDKKTESWLLKLPVYYRLIKENKEFNNLWKDYLKRTEAIIPQFMEAIDEAKISVMSKFKINEDMLPSIGIIPNVLGSPYSADFEKINGVVYTITAQPNKSCIIHEYLHNILEHAINSSIETIKEYVHLLNPVYESMFKYKYAWSKDEESWCRVFEESLIRAATILVNELNESDTDDCLMKEASAGFIYVPVLFERLKSNWNGVQEFDKFVECCLQKL